jgi:hypothetical protein
VAEELPHPAPETEPRLIGFRDDRELLEILFRIVRHRLDALSRGSPLDVLEPFTGGVLWGAPQADLEGAADELAAARILHHQLVCRLGAGGDATLARAFVRWRLGAGDVLVLAAALAVDLSPEIAVAIGEMRIGRMRSGRSPGLTIARLGELLGGGPWAPLEVEALVGERAPLTRLGLIELEESPSWAEVRVLASRRLLPLARGVCDWRCPSARLDDRRPLSAPALPEVARQRLLELISGGGRLVVRAPRPADARVAMAIACAAAGRPLAILEPRSPIRWSAVAREAALHGAVVFVDSGAGSWGDLDQLAEAAPVAVAVGHDDPIAADIELEPPAAADRRAALDANLAAIIGPRGRALAGRIAVGAADLERAISELVASPGQAGRADVGRALIHAGSPWLASSLRRPRPASPTPGEIREAAAAVRAHWERRLAAGAPVGAVVAIGGGAATRLEIAEALAAELELALGDAAVHEHWALPCVLIVGPPPAASGSRFEAVAVVAADAGATADIVIGDRLAQ